MLTIFFFSCSGESEETNNSSNKPTEQTETKFISKTKNIKNDENTLRIIATAVSSSNEKVATVQINGDSIEITSKSEGGATITCTKDTLSAEISVTVDEKGEISCGITKATPQAPENPSDEQEGGSGEGEQGSGGEQGEGSGSGTESGGSDETGGIGESGEQGNNEGESDGESSEKNADLMKMLLEFADVKIDESEILLSEFTLDAKTLRLLGDISSGFIFDENENKVTNLTDESFKDNLSSVYKVTSVSDELKLAIKLLQKKDFNIERNEESGKKKYTISTVSGKTIKLTGEFDFDNDYIINKGANLNFDDATFTATYDRTFSSINIFKQYKDLTNKQDIVVSDILTSRNNTDNNMPKMSYIISNDTANNENEMHEYYAKLIALYKIYDDKISLLSLDDKKKTLENNNPNPAQSLDFRDCLLNESDALNDTLKKGYSLFTETNSENVKKYGYDALNENGTISIPVELLVKLNREHDIAVFKNIIVTGDSKLLPNKSQINARFTNVVFKDDMSNIYNIYADVSVPEFDGVVYFMNKLYIMSANKGREGSVLKIDIPNNITVNGNSNVIDLRGRNSLGNAINIKINEWIQNFNNTDLIVGGSVDAMYFPIEFEKDNIHKLEDYFVKFGDRYESINVNNIYFNGKRYVGEYPDAPMSRYILTSKNSRSLTEFEYFGNNNGQFQTSAWSSYGIDDTENVSDEEKENKLKLILEDYDEHKNKYDTAIPKLHQDDDTKQIAKYNKKVDFAIMLS